MVETAEVPDSHLKELDTETLFREAKRCHNESARLKEEPYMREMSESCARRAALCLKLWRKKMGVSPTELAAALGLVKPQPRPAKRPPKSVSARVFSRWGRS